MIQLKVKRDKLAKEFPLIATKKHGDVGYDLPSVFPIKEEYMDKQAPWEEDEIMKHIETEVLASNPDASYDEVVRAYNKEVHESMIINPGQRVLVPTGISLEIPEGYWIELAARSSTSKKLLIVPKGVIDQGYRGELFAQVINVGQEPVEVVHGDRLVQIILYKSYASDTSIVEVDELTPSERGATGFGSTGQGEYKKSDFVPSTSASYEEHCGCCSYNDCGEYCDDPNNTDDID